MAKKSKNKAINAIKENRSQISAMLKRDYREILENGCEYSILYYLDTETGEIVFEKGGDTVSTDPDHAYIGSLRESIDSLNEFGADILISSFDPEKKMDTWIKNLEYVDKIFNNIFKDIE